MYVVKYNVMSGDPKAKYVGAESGGGRPKGKGFITELQRQKLKPAHLDVIVEKNKARNHYPKRVSDEKWAKGSLRSSISSTSATSISSTSATSISATSISATGGTDQFDLCSLLYLFFSF